MLPPPPSLTRQTINIVFDQDNQTKQDAISPITSGDEVNIIFNHTGGNLSPSSSASPSTIEINGGKLQIDINAANSTNTINAGLNFSNTNSGALTNTGVINFNENGTLNFTNSGSYYPSIYDSITSTMTINIDASGDSKIGGGINFGQQQTTINFLQASSSKFTLDTSSNGGSQINGLTIINFDHSNDIFEIEKNPSFTPTYTFQALQINLNKGSSQEKNTFIGNITVDTMSSSSSNNLLQSSINFNQENTYLLVDGKISSDVHIASMPNETTRGLQINFLKGNGTLEIKPSTPSNNPGYPSTDQYIHDISGAIINIGNTNNEAHAHIISDFSSENSTSGENYIVFQHDNSSLSVNGTFGSMNSMGSSMGKNTIRLDGANIAYITSDLVGNYYNSYPSSPTIERPKNIIEIDSAKTLKLSTMDEKDPKVKKVKGFNIVFKGETGSFVGNLAGGVVVDFGETYNNGYPSNPPSFSTQTITFDGSVDTVYDEKYSGDNIFSFNSSSSQGMVRNVVINSSGALRLNHQRGYANVFELAGTSSMSSSYGQNVTINTDIYLTGVLSQYPNPNPPGSTTYRREGNIFNIAGGRLTLGEKDSRKTLYTQSGLTQINFNSSSSNYSGYFEGNISTTGGTTKIILGHGGSSPYGLYQLAGDIQASNSGVNRFENGGSGSEGILEIQGTITANDGGINIFTRDTSNSSYSKTFFNNLVFQASGSGKNIIEIYSGESFSVKKIDNTQPPPSTSQNPALGDIKTQSGTTYINFKYSSPGGSTSAFASNLIADGGNNLITFEKIPQDPSMPSTTTRYDLSFVSTLIANGGNTNTFVFAQDTNFQNYSSTPYQGQTGTIVASGTNTTGGNIFRIKEGVSLGISGQSMSPSIHTISGSTRIEFLGKTGSFGGEVLTSGGVTTFALLGGDLTSISFGGIGVPSFALTSNESGVNKITFSGINSTLDLSHTSTMLIQANGGGKNIFEIAYEGTQINYISPDGLSFQGDGQDLNGGNSVEFTSNNASLKIMENQNLSKLTVGSGIGKIEFNANNGSMLSLFKVGSNTFAMPPMGQTTILQQGYVELNKENTQNALKGMSVYYDKGMGASSYTLKTNGYINFNANQTILNIADGITLDGGSLDINFNANESELNSIFSFSNDSKLGIHLREEDSHNTINQTLIAENALIRIDTLDTDNHAVSSVAFETNGIEAKTHQIDIVFSGIGGKSTLIAENIITNGENINISFSENGKIQGNLQAISDVNSVSFLANGEVVGDIKSSGGNNKIYLNGGNYTVNGDVESSGGSNEFIFNSQGKFSFLGSRVQNILASDSGKNHFYFSDSANSFSIASDVYARSSDSGVNLFEISGGKELRFADGENLKSLVTTLGKTTISFSDTQPNKQATGSFVGNLVANGGNNEIIFADDGVFSFLGSIESRQGSSNVFAINHNIVFSSDMETSAQNSGENIFRVSSGKTLQFGENADKAIKTHSGSTKMLLSSTSIIKGEFFSDGGKNIISFDTSSGDLAFQASVEGSFNVEGSGQNILDINLASISLTSDEKIVMLGQKNLTGFNQILFSNADTTLSLKNIQETALQTFETQGGLTRVDFKGDNSIFEANSSVINGKLVFNFDKSSQISGTLDVSEVGETEINISDGEIATLTKPITINGDQATFLANIGNNSTLSIGGNLSTISGETSFSFNGGVGTISGTFITGAGASTIFNLGSVGSEEVVATISGSVSNANAGVGAGSGGNGGENTFAINAKNTTLKSAITFSSGLNIISFENASESVLRWQDMDGNSQAITTTGGNTLIDFKNNGIIDGAIATNGADAITTINLSNGVMGVVNGAISTTSGSSIVEFDGSNNKLILKDDATFTSISNLKNQLKVYGSNNGISFYHDQRSGKAFKTLTIGTKDSKTEGIIGENLNFVVYAVNNKPQDSSTPISRSYSSSSGSYADKIIIHSSGNQDKDGNIKETIHHLGVVFESGTKFDDIVYKKGDSNNILVATVAKNSGVIFDKTERTVLGFTVASVEYTTESTDENGKEGSDYTSYYIGKSVADEVVIAEQATVATAFMLNYDLYMANFNSLNKRMGELRENAHSQGVWARVFNGTQSNSSGLGSKSNYTTIQAGYDYAFGFEGSNNYLGFAFSYALSTSKTSSQAVDSMGQVRGVDNIYSNAVELAVYNSYVSDMGWYNDSIAKFSYLMSNFEIQNSNTHSTTKNNTNNFALTLGDEVGYRFALGGNDEWSIIPQLELGFGYFNQSDFKQIVQEAFLNSTADSVFTLRARAGSSFSYDFKNFTQENDFNASVYIGAFYEYDYVSGGEIFMSTDQGIQSNEFSDISSDGRIVMNVGTNMAIKDNTRLYFDFEKSFVGNITTDYQVNFGVRYSFGESNGYAPIAQNVETQEESKAPLKIEEKDADKEKLGSQKEKVEDKKGGSSQEVQDSNEAKQEDDNNKNLNTKKNKKSIE